MLFNITNLEFTQVTIELFGALVCVFSFTFISFYKSEKKNLHYFKYLFAICFVLFSFESLAYIFRGNTDSVSIYINSISNFVVFSGNIVLVLIFSLYLYGILHSINVKPKNIYRYITESLLLIAFIILLLNLFLGWMYSINEQNYYERNYMFYVYSGLILVSSIPLVVLSFVYRKEMGKKMAFMNILFVSIPFISTILQLFFQGISITNLGIGITLVIMLIIYFRDWSKSEYEDIHEKKKKRRIELIVLFVIMAISMSASLITCLYSLDNVSKEYSQKDSTTISELVSNKIETKILEPLMVSKTMSQDNSLINKLHNSSVNNDPNSITDDLSSYLNKLADGFGYSQAYIICDATKTYYVSTGIAKTVSTGDENDAWYFDFINSQKDYELNVDYDEFYEYKVSLFVNKRIYDINGNPLGVVGVGVNINEFINEFKKYEDEYGIELSLVDRNGLIQVCSNEMKIEKDRIDSSYFTSVSSDEFYYEKLNNEARLTKYIDTFDWYIIVKDLNVNKINTISITFPSMIIFAGGLLLFGAILAFFNAREHKTYNQLLERKHESLTDEMTGLFNRRAYEADIASIEEEKDMYSIVMIDVNGLKNTNDSLGHKAGDELIIALSNIILAVFNLSKCYRIGGDEFIVITPSGKDKVKSALKELAFLARTYKGKYISDISYSWGYVAVSEHPELSIVDAINLADEYMYQNKKEYYEKSKKNNTHIK